MLAIVPARLAAGSGGNNVWCLPAAFLPTFSAAGKSRSGASEARAEKNYESALAPDTPPLLYLQRMRKAAGKTTNIDDVEQSLAALTAKRQFLAATSNMGWRLALTVVIPIVGGVKIDEHFKTSPSFTLMGLMIAAVAGCAAVWATVKEINREQAEDTSKKSNRRITHV